ncbi:MAG TPA: rhomboid family intramembrane serine protease [Desertimonas sp.]|nr:rhomboid family intramembrane serine protease [Desertimonas sp.]
MKVASIPTTDVERPRLAELAPGLVVVAVLLGAMWALEVVDLVPGTPFDRWGVRPRTARGLLGIAAAPFLHVSFAHLIANTIPFAVLGAAIALGGVRQIVEVTIIVALVSGLGVWLLGAGNSVHLGASGLVFGYLTYLVTRGVIAKNVWWVVGGLIVLAFYGGLFWGLVPTPRVSWLGHVFGAIGGILAAWVLHGDHGPPEAAEPPAVAPPVR